MIVHISNIESDSFSGGWNGMNYQVLKGLREKFAVKNYCINPPIFEIDKWQSRFWRALKMKGVFPIFSERRLNVVGNFFKDLTIKKNDFIMFHGATSWLNCDIQNNYAVYLDASFYTYMQVYQSAEKFSQKQLKMLFDKERIFLENASNVFFTSSWALEDARNYYQLKKSHYEVAAPGCDFEITTPSTTKESSTDILFVGLDFLGKGGDLIAAAVEKLIDQIPNIQLKIVGEQPPKELLNKSFIKYLGRKNKSIESELEALKQLYKNAFCFVLPTQKDMTPLVLLEAMSSGCLVIASDKYGITEMLANGESGLLIRERDSSIEGIATLIMKLYKNKKLTHKLRQNAYKLLKTKYNWNESNATITNAIKRSLQQHA